MAMMDYGAIAWKDGKLISTDMFTPMIDTVGWHDNKINGSNFVTIGDEDLTLGFYKNIITIVRTEHVVEYHFIGNTEYEGWRYWRKMLIVNEDIVEIFVKSKRFHDYYVCKLKYRGHKYKVAFGYGVDLDGYKKWHMIDYYKIPWVRFDTWWYYHGRPIVKKIKNYLKIGEKK